MKKKLLICLTFFIVITLGIIFTISNPDKNEIANTEKSTADNQGNISIQWNKTSQNIDGFGVAQAGWSNYLYANYSREEIMDKLFGKDGLNLSILRGEVFPVFLKKGIEDFATNSDLNISLTDSFFDKIDGNNELLRRAQLWITNIAKKKFGVDKLVFSTWSPPAYMKSNNSTSKGKLNLEDYGNFAKYLTDFVHAYTNYGLPVYALSPVNEPEYPADWSSCTWVPINIDNFLKNYMSPAFKKESLSTKFIFTEDGQWSDWLFGQMGSSVYVKKTLDGPYDLSGLPLIAAGHGYPDPLTHHYTKKIPFDSAESRGIPMWLTEVSDISKYDPSMQDGIDWANQWQEYMTKAHTSALIWWAGAIPGDNGEGLINMNKEDRKSYKLTKRYSTFGNFSKYIPVNSQRINVKYNLPDGITASAYKKGNKWTLVLVNDTNKNINSSFGIDSIGKNIKKVKNVHSFITDKDNDWLEKKVFPDNNGKYIFTTTAKSVITFTGELD